ncbi:MAG: hypothetical protein M0Z41_15380 [Peptococcaceae bacterium]|nr:hypothetical protein [Peptococcaceae bacterium]
MEAQGINKDKDSRFANGIWPARMRSGRMEPSSDCPGKGPELLECLREAGAMTRTAAAAAPCCGRYEVGTVAKSLWRAGMLEMFSVFSRDRYGVGARFELWLVGGAKPPAGAREACRLAALALFYGHAGTEMPGFGWKLTRIPRRPVMAEVTFRNAHEPVRWLVDAPRRGEAPRPEADLFIFPTRGEAERKTPAGKRYTWDLAVINARPDQLREAVKRAPG